MATISLPGVPVLPTSYVVSKRFSTPKSEERHSLEARVTVSSLFGFTSPLGKDEGLRKGERR